ncbi:hypothetical protein V8F20_000007 [Naviculisporaceae sp. PSN 640]
MSVSLHSNPGKFVSLILIFSIFLREKSKHVHGCQAHHRAELNEPRLVVDGPSEERALRFEMEYGLKCRVDAKAGLPRRVHLPRGLIVSLVPMVATTTRAKKPISTQAEGQENTVDMYQNLKLYAFSRRLSGVFAGVLRWLHSVWSKPSDRLLISIRITRWCRKVPQLPSIYGGGRRLPGLDGREVTRIPRNWWPFSPSSVHVLMRGHCACPVTFLGTKEPGVNLRGAMTVSSA